jgi:hypothetical protein
MNNMSNKDRNQQIEFNNSGQDNLTKSPMPSPFVSVEPKVKD